MTIKKLTKLINEFNLESLRKEFVKTGYVKIPFFFTQNNFELLAEEVFSLLGDYSRRKDFIMEDTGFTSRNISTVSGNIISQHSEIIPTFYQDKGLINFLQNLANEKLYLTPDMADRHAIHKLHMEKDTHGAHLDTYPYVLITCFESPGEDGGGELEFVPFSKNLKDLTTEKTITDSLKVGDTYFMHASESIHRVLPLNKKVNRTVLVFTFANEKSKNIEVSYSSNKLYD